MRKVLITGAGGFVGQHVVNLLKNDYFIVGLLTHKNSDIKLNKNGVYVYGNVLNQEFLKQTLEKYKPEFIVHLAAKITPWSENVNEFFQVNLFGTLNLYGAVSDLKEKDAYSPKILYISSSEIYGKTKNQTNIKEASATFPVSFYAASKASADHLSFSFSQIKKLNIIILRPFTHTGPGQKTGFFVPDMASQIVQIEKGSKNRKIRVGNLDSIRDYLDVGDVVRAYKLIMETNCQPGECFNICSGQGKKMRDVLKTLLSFAKKKIDIKVDPSRMRPSDIPVFIGNHDKITKSTGWKPEIDFDQTLRETLNYWRNLTPSD